MDLSTVIVFFIGVYVGQEYTEIPNVQAKVVEIYNLYLHFRNQTKDQ